MSSPAPTPQTPARKEVDPALLILSVLVGVLVLFVGADQVRRALERHPAALRAGPAVVAYAVDQHSGCQYQIVQSAGRLVAKPMRGANGAQLCSGGQSH